LDESNDCLPAFYGALNVNEMGMNDAAICTFVEITMMLRCRIIQGLNIDCCIWTSGQNGWLEKGSRFVGLQAPFHLLHQQQCDSIFLIKLYSWISILKCRIPGSVLRWNGLPDGQHDYLMASASSDLRTKIQRAFSLGRKGILRDKKIGLVPRP
jgi:hypothetical protein